MFDSQTTPEGIIKKSNELYKKEGIGPFIEILKRNDPGSFTAYHANDHYRVRRAVEHFWSNGTQFSRKKELMLQQRDQTSNIKKYGWDILHIHLDLPKEQHLQIIQKRTKQMLNLGLEKEVRNLKSNGYTMKEKPLQSIGYKETIAFMENELTEDELIEKINISTRQLAKAQRTWFKKIDKNTFHPLLQIQEIEDFVKIFLKK
jgi:tRNA dimethylallyltransferase